MVHFSFETLALLYKNFGNLVENAMTPSYKGAIPKCGPVNCDSKILGAVSYSQTTCKL